MIALHIDPKEFERILLPLSGMPAAIRGALWQAVKRSLSTMKQELSISIRKNSFLPVKTINAAITKPQMCGYERRGNIKTQSDSIMGAVRVASRNLALDNFKLVPNRPSAHKGASTGWKPAGFQIGPNEPVRYRDRANGLSKGFVLRGKSKLLFFQSMQGKRRRYPSGRAGYVLLRPASYSVQYFAAFDATVQTVSTKAKERFDAVLAHEVQYRLEKLK